MLSLFRKQSHKMTIIAEFNNSDNSERVLSLFSKFVSLKLKADDEILTDVQRFPAGIRITFVLTYTTSFFRRKNYTKEFSNLFDWLSNDKDCSGCLSRYHYSNV